MDKFSSYDFIFCTILSFFAARHACVVSNLVSYETLSAYLSTQRGKEEGTTKSRKGREGRAGLDIIFNSKFGVEVCFII